MKKIEELKRIIQELGRHFTPEQLISRTMFDKYPEDFFKFYKEHLIYPDAKPNKAHYFLAELENKGKLRAVITQNIDTLHEIAGSKNVLKLHGTVDSNYCRKCGKHYNLEEFLAKESIIPLCECGGIIKPYVTLYEEELDMTVFSLYPAANLIRHFRGNHLVVINKTSTSQDRMATLVISGKIGEVFEKINNVN